MSLTRDDMLRELELLPVWRLRTPLANDVACVTKLNVTPLAASIDALVAQTTSFANAAKKIDNPNLIQGIHQRGYNQLLGREGAFWQRESYDHLVRDEDGFNHALEYIIQNPVKANLVKLSDEYAFGSAFAGKGACAITSTTTPTTTPGAASKDALVAQAPSPAGAESSNDLVAQATSFASLTPIQQLLTCSADKKWAFIWPASLDLSTSQSLLFSNILNALKIDKTNKTVLASLVDVEAKVIIAMGEIAAQQLLNTQDSLEQLRGNPHLMHNIPLIVTYHPSDCLKYLPNKAKVWDDLCVALSIINA